MIPLRAPPLSSKELNQMQHKMEQESLVGGAGNLSPPTNYSHRIITPFRFYQGIRVLVLCLAYMGIGPTLILLNKHLMMDLDGRGFNYPMFLSCLGLVSSSIAAQIAIRFRKVEPKQPSHLTWSFYLSHILPVGATQALTLALGNAVYMWLSVSFIQMLKAFTPVVVLIVGVLLNVEKPSRQIVASVVGISLGTALASLGEVNSSMVGMTIMLFSEISEAIKLVLTQYLLKNLKFGVLESLYYLSPAGAICLFSSSLLLEVPSMRRQGAFQQMLAHPALFLAAATLGLGVHVLSFLVVQATNSVTLKVLGTARNALLVVFSILVHSEVVTSLQLAGYLCALSFFALYTFLKTQNRTSK